jgi:uncharacterized protein YjbI with pentapeptide repeats
MQSDDLAWPPLAPPRITATEPASDAPGRDDDEEHDLWLGGVRIVGLDLERPELVDLRLEDCDLSGIIATGYVARRLAVRNTRLRSVMATGGQCDDLVLDGCQTEQVSFRFSRLRRVVFRNSRLTSIDFYGVHFDQVLIEGCDLSGAAFDNAVVDTLRIRDCDFTGITGAARLRGAEVDASDLPSLAPSLALDAGLRLRDA